MLGEDPATPAGARARQALGYLPENVALYPALTGNEILTFYARLKGADLAGNKPLLARVGLAEAAGAARRNLLQGNAPAAWTCSGAARSPARAAAR